MFLWHKMHDTYQCSFALTYYVIYSFQVELILLKSIVSKDLANLLY